MSKIYLLLILLLVSFICVEGFKKGEKGKSKHVHEKRIQPLKKPEDIRVEVMFRPSECSKKSRPGDTLSMHYTGFLQDGTIFDTSSQRGPFSFTLGAGQVIPGWERGLQGMCVGEKRKLTVPPQYAYGEAGHPPVIPPSSTLVFETELYTEYSITNT